MLRRAAETPDNVFVHALDGPVDLHALHRYAPERYPFLLQSTASDSALGRYDILFASPGERIALKSPGEVEGADGSSFLDALDAAWRSAGAVAGHSDLPFTGGWFLYLGYELAAEIEPGLELGVDPILPAAFAVRCKAAVIVDRDDGSCSFIHENNTELTLDDLLADVVTSEASVRPRSVATSERAQIDEEPETHFREAVLAAKEHIAAGDVYQANLSRSWRHSTEGAVNADNIYERLGQSNPAPFAGLARWEDAAIISSSPERLLRISGREVSTRPIAGTRPRSDDKNLDDDLSAELFAHPKEVAEHVMLIDLERNDLGRICEPGTVEVDEMMVLESYAHVHHIVSNVRGQIRADVSPGDAIRAVFPGGTITGCPKVRCMEIIQELEQSPRGAYTGSFGYLNRNGDLDLNILIRTMVAQGNCVTFRAGSGIVADSEPLAELAETRAKAKGMLRALYSE